LLQEPAKSGHDRAFGSEDEGLMSIPLPLLIGLAVVGFAIFFSGLWCAICFVMATAGGWSALARRYPATSPPSGARHTMVRGAVGAVEYNGSLNVSVSADGLYLSVFRLLKVAHPDLFIPWNAVSARQDRKLFRWEIAQLSIGQPPVAKITLPKRVVDDPARIAV
jgi:hypothetical protein